MNLSVLPVRIVRRGVVRVFIFEAILLHVDEIYLE